MKLTALRPEWEIENSYLTFDCPTCPREGESRYSNCLIMIPIAPHGDAELGSERGWQSNGETDFEKLTIAPSIWHHCKTDPHFFIREGNIQFA